MTTVEPEETYQFADLGLRPELVSALEALGYEEPTPIQREAIPVLIAGRDLLGQAATGTGKTAAFALPMLNRIAGIDRQAPAALVLVPTRELAVQVSEAIHRYGRALGVRVLPIYGGQPIGRQLAALHRGVDVVVATPGRALDHIRRGTLALDKIEVVVLDEADEMLDMGFVDDIEAILGDAPATRQTLLFSATLPGRIESLTKRYLRDPLRIVIARELVPEGDEPRVRQTAFIVARAHKAAALGRVLDVEAPAAALVFCRTRNEVEELTEAMNARGYRAEALHGGMTQEQRDRVMRKLRSENAELLIATDVAARGLDIEHLTHVINYDVPSAPESYVHRIGRVGRAGREGIAITLAEPREHRMLRNIERLTRQRINIEKVPTVADLRARRMDVTRASIREAILQQDDLEHFRVVVDSLSDEFDVVDVALAAVKLAHEAMGGSEDTQEIPAPQPRTHEAGPGRERATRGDRGERSERGDRGDRGARPRGPARGGMARIYIGLGRKGGVRPQDIVGAIANEAGIRGREIGAIEIAERHSLVEVGEDVAADVIDALRASTVKGRKVTVRRE